MLSRVRKRDILEKLAAKKKSAPASESEPPLKPAPKYKSPIYGEISSGWDKAKANPGRVVRHSSNQTEMVEGDRRRGALKGSSSSPVQKLTGGLQSHLKRTGLIPKLPGGA